MTLNFYLVRLSLLFTLLFSLYSAAVAGAITTFSSKVTANGGTFHVKGICVDLKDPAVSVQLGLPGGRVGHTDGLASIAQQYHAKAAINGSFFDAYTRDPLKNPDMTLITGGQVVFKSNIGSLLGFKADNTPMIAHVRYRLWGTVSSGGRPRQWHAYWFNRKPTASPCVTIFTRQWGTRVESMQGALVVIKNNFVSEITNKAVVIPENGYVVHIRGDAKLLSYFNEGDAVTFTPQMEIDGATAADWAQVREAVGGGPRVLVDGKPVFNPDAEGFTDPKILQRSGVRSAVGYSADRYLYLITTSGARVGDLGYILKALGCVQGINLDGGASSGLWYKGAYLTKPGRQISNALCIMEK